VLRAWEAGPARQAGRPALTVVPNPDYPAGKSTSLIAGAAAADPAHDLLVAAVDQPRPAALLGRLLAAHREQAALITVPGAAGRRGHPPLFAPALRPELLAVTEAGQGLREVMRRHVAQVLVVPWATPVPLLNLNTPQDYRLAAGLAWG